MRTGDDLFLFKSLIDHGINELFFLSSLHAATLWSEVFYANNDDFS